MRVSRWSGWLDGTGATSPGAFGIRDPADELLEPAAVLGPPLSVPKWNAPSK
jgi:hypothetical protein